MDAGDRVPEGCQAAAGARLVREAFDLHHIAAARLGRDLGGTRAARCKARLAQQDAP